MRLKDKVCIVTGGGSGIGRATCRVLAREGAKVVVADRKPEAAAAVARELPGALALSVDVSKSAEVKRMIDDTVKAFGRLDVIVNNAGYGTFGTVVDIDEQEWDDLMAVNVRGVYLCCKHAIPAMKRTGGGAIVNVASVVASIGIRNRAAYVASKGAVAALTRAIALDHVAEGIRCNAIAPGTIDTPYYDDVMARAPDPVAFRKGLEARQPIGRLGTAEEMADCILFLASDESRFALGAIVTIDGGMTAQ
ncbi:MAG: SDR family oxidoreductase [Alphaproteobacteria bacterium]|nr:SDR family oxidoreductase [Alphaproteobacteria bacterium]